MKFYVVEMLISGPLMERGNFEIVCANFIRSMCREGWHLGEWPADARAIDVE